jgi:hypothetical protein
MDFALPGGQIVADFARTGPRAKPSDSKNRLRAKTIFANRFKLITPVQPSA